MASKVTAGSFPFDCTLFFMLQGFHMLQQPLWSVSMQGLGKIQKVFENAYVRSFYRGSNGLLSAEAYKLRVSDISAQNGLNRIW